MNSSWVKGRLRTAVAEYLGSDPEHRGMQLTRGSEGRPGPTLGSHLDRGLWLRSQEARAEAPTQAERHRAGRKAQVVHSEKGTAELADKCKSYVLKNSKAQTQNIRKK